MIISKLCIVLVLVFFINEQYYVFFNLTFIHFLTKKSINYVLFIINYNTVILIYLYLYIFFIIRKIHNYSPVMTIVAYKQHVGKLGKTKYHN